MESRYLYKAKRKDNGEWVEGYYQKRKEEFENDEHLIFRSESYHTWEYAEVDPKTLCQCTGLTDKNGKLIWENDIAHYHGTHDDVCIIRFGEYSNNGHGKHIGFYADWDTYGFLFRQDLGFWIEERNIEVIGSIFDNPELLEGQV